MRKIGNKAIIVSCIVSLPLLITSCEPTLINKVKAFQEAINNHDIEKSMSFYADDVRFELLGTPMVIEGRENLRKPIEEQFILNNHLTLTDIKADGNTVTCKVKEQNDMLKAAGIDALHYDYNRLTFKDGLIKQEIAKPTQETLKIMAEFREPFEKWASEKRTQQWAKLKSKGITKENVSEWLDITRQWREEMKQERK